MAFYQLKTLQVLPAPPDIIWKFISTPANLKKITPQYMGFDITSEVPETIYPGLMIGYKVKPVAGIKMNWVTEITHVSDQKYFVDEQRIGPYKIWHHEHHIEAIPNGTKMIDIVTYVPPFGILGKLANWMFIRRQLREIFEYRRIALTVEFGEYGISYEIA